ncbi:MAG TPA: helix-turn-helix domain-containing protein [Candidatus Pristimantibacillus sp.]|nr:helix-turn-helix domain-containing protein [Candidatus Pristimantibacillus sp.]
MLTETTAIRTYFGKLGFEPEIADIYLALHTHGPQSISELSRNSKVERTRIYRLIDKLMENSLIEVESHYKRGIIKAAPIANLSIVITQKEQELKALQDELGLIQQVLARNSLSDPATRVQFYQGTEGIRQMLWNELRAKSEIVGYANRILEEATGKKFMERWTDEFEARGLRSRILLNDDFIASWKAGRKTVGTDRRVKDMEYNYIPDSVFRLTHLCDIYDNVVVYYHWKNGEVFGLEIYNQEIADTQRQFFEMLWPKSKPDTSF